MSRRTHIAIITEARDFAASRDFDSDGNMSTSILRYYLDLLDVAHRHEVQNALDAGGFVEASRKNKQVGHTAKLRKGRRIQFALNFWTRVAAVTRLGLHGFVLWRIRRAYERAVEFNMIAQAHNRRVRKERRRLEAKKED